MISPSYKASSKALEKAAAALENATYNLATAYFQKLMSSSN
jgi:hypothetical protein